MQSSMSPPYNNRAAPERPKLLVELQGYLCPVSATVMPNRYAR